MEVTKGTDPRVKAKAKVEDVAMGMVTHKVEVAEIVSLWKRTPTKKVSCIWTDVLNAMKKNILQKCASLEANHRVKIVVKVKDNQCLKAKIENSVKLYGVTLMMKVNRWLWQSVACASYKAAPSKLSKILPKI